MLDARRGINNKSVWENLGVDENILCLDLLVVVWLCICQNPKTFYQKRVHFSMGKLYLNKTLVKGKGCKYFTQAFQEKIKIAYKNK